MWPHPGRHKETVHMLVPSKDSTGEQLASTPPPPKEPHRYPPAPNGTASVPSISRTAASQKVPNLYLFNTERYRIGTFLPNKRPPPRPTACTRGYRSKGLPLRGMDGWQPQCGDRLTWEIAERTSHHRMRMFIMVTTKLGLGLLLANIFTGRSKPTFAEMAAATTMSLPPLETAPSLPVRRAEVSHSYHHKPLLVYPATSSPRGAHAHIHHVLSLRQKLTCSSYILPRDHHLELTPTFTTCCLYVKSLRAPHTSCHLLTTCSSRPHSPRVVFTSKAYVLLRHPATCSPRGAHAHIHHVLSLRQKLTWFRPTAHRLLLLQRLHCCYSKEAYHNNYNPTSR